MTNASHLTRPNGAEKGLSRTHPSSEPGDAALIEANAACHTPGRARARGRGLLRVGPPTNTAGARPLGAAAWYAKQQDTSEMRHRSSASHSSRNGLAARNSTWRLHGAATPADERLHHRPRPTDMTVRRCTPAAIVALSRLLQQVRYDDARPAPSAAEKGQRHPPQAAPGTRRRTAGRSCCLQSRRGPARCIRYNARPQTSRIAGAQP